MVQLERKVQGSGQDRGRIQHTLPYPGFNALSPAPSPLNFFCFAISQGHLPRPPTLTPIMENFHRHQTQHSGANYTTASKIPHACNTNRTVEDLQKYAALT